MSTGGSYILVKNRRKIAPTTSFGQKKTPGSLMREPGDAGRPPEAASRKLTEDDFFVEAQPVVQIVEVDGIKDFPSSLMLLAPRMALRVASLW